MSLLVRCNETANLGQVLISEFLRMTGSVPVRDGSGTLLERSVEEPEVGVVLALGIL